MRQPPKPEDFASPLHDPKVVARVGVWLAACFTLCFLTGVVSHLHQHPLSFVSIPAAPVWGYRVSQGLHVVSGFACVPLILAKL